jgi:hypothetical protein
MAPLIYTFRLQYKKKVTTIMVFLGWVEARLRLLFSDTRDKIVPTVDKWILIE